MVSKLDTLTLSRGTLSVDLYPWLHGSYEEGTQALAGITGFGLPPLSNRWFEGAGAGATYRGARVMPRVIMLPLVSMGPSREALDGLLSMIARILAPVGSEQARLTYRHANGTNWYLDVVREDGGDYVREAKGFNRDRMFKTTLGLKAGDPFWTRAEPLEFTIRQDDSGRGLMPYLAELEVSSGSVYGDMTIENEGDAPAWPVWTIGGPMTGFTLTGASGEVIAWNGTMVAGERRIIEAKRALIYDENGVNRYNELDSAPNFWAIPAEPYGVKIETEGADAASYVSAQWQPRKWSIV